MLRRGKKAARQGGESLPKGMRQTTFLSCSTSMKQTLEYLAIAAVAGLLLGVAACDRKETSSSDTKAKSAPKAGARSVEVPAAQKQFLTIEAAGVAQDGDVLVLPGRIGAAVPGRVAAVLVRPGERVKAGAPLLAIDSADAASGRAALDQATSRLASAENMFKRQVEMVEKGVGLDIDRQEAEARLKEARAEHERARNAAGMVGSGQGNRYTIRAPADGVVMAIRVAVGASVAPGGDALVELGDPNRLHVVAHVPEGEMRRVAVGQEAEVELPALALRVAARVESFSPRVDPESRRAQLFLALDKPSGGTADAAGGLRAGMLAHVKLRVAGEDGLSVPIGAVLIKDGKRRVVYVERPDGTFEAREVQTGRNRDGRVLILQGLQAGERIVVRGGLLLDTQAEQLL
jgi:cobalt-zinc-cadmium efflux system membrane fusion protein